MEFKTNASTPVTNASSSDPFQITAGLIFTNICVCILSVLTIGGNALTIMVFTRNSSLRNNPLSNRHIMSLAVADIGVGLIPLPILIIVTSLDRWPFGFHLCMVKSIVEGSFLIVTIFTIAFISLDRYLLVHREYPVYLESQTKRRINLQIAFTWVFSIITMTTNEIIFYMQVGLDHTVDLYCNFHTNPDPLPTLFLLMILLFIPMSSIGYFNLNTFLNIRKRILRRRRIGIVDDGASMTVNTVAICNPVAHEQPRKDTTKEKNRKRPVRSSTRINLRAEKSQPAKDNFKRRYIKPAIMMGVLLSTFLVCWAPLGVTGIIKNFRTVFKDGRHWKWIHLCMYADSVFNPILYAITNKKVRIAMIKCIQRK